MKRKFIGGPLDGKIVLLSHEIRVYVFPEFIDYFIDHGRAPVGNDPVYIHHLYHMRGNEDFVYMGTKPNQKGMKYD